MLARSAEEPPNWSELIRELLTRLEMRQAEGTLSFKTPHRLPVFFFTELIALALGKEEARSWFPKHLIDPQPLLRGAGLL